MKIKNLMFVGLVLAGLSACSNDNADIPSVETHDEYDTYLTLKLTGGDLTPATRGSVTSTDNMNISTVHVYLTKNGEIVRGLSAEVKNEAGQQTIEKLSVPSGEYRVFVVANPIVAENAPRQSGSFNKLIEGIDHSAAKAGFENGKFLMTSSFKELEYLEKAGEEVNIKTEHNKANPLAVTIHLDRAAVKVVPFKTDFSIKPGSEIDNVKTVSGVDFFQTIQYQGYTLVNGNKKMNLIQQWGTDTKITGKFVVTPAGTQVVGGFIEGYYNPFQTLAAWVDGTKNMADLTIGKTDVFIKDPVFTVENRPPFNFQTVLTSGMAQTTAVVYKTVVNDGATFYYFAGKVYKTTAELKQLDAFKGWSDTDLKNAPKLRSTGVKVYENGTMYYTYFIKDALNTVTYNGQSVQPNGVYRNSTYNLKVNSVSSIGDDVPGGGKVTPDTPNPPIDPDESYIDVSVSVNPWGVNNMEIEF